MTAVGIDLGTTYSVVAYSKDGQTAEAIVNKMGTKTTPSVVFFSQDDDEALVGQEAKNTARLDPGNTFSFIKREMGNDSVLYEKGEVEFHAADISALILKYLKESAEEYIGEVDSAVITVPAYFDDVRRTATIQAGKIAGLNVMHIINEPTAAAFAFGLGTDKTGRVLVYDLGGGTFDVTLMDISKENVGDIATKQLDVKATDGDHGLGGKNFDDCVIELFRSALEEQGCELDDGDLIVAADMREKAELLKIQLSSKTSATMRFTIGGKNYKVEVSRERFEDATRDLLERTKEMAERLIIEQGVAWSDLDYLLMIGGSTHMPMVKAMLEEISGKTLTYEIDPDSAVATGAALYASIFSESSSKENGEGVQGSSTRGSIPVPVISDVTSQSLGIIALNDSGNLYNSIIYKRNSKIPGGSSEEYSTVSDNQTSLRVRVTEGDDTDIEFVNIIGERTLEIPPYPKGAPIRVTFNYDIDQTIFIEVEDLTAGKSLGSFEIERASNLSSDELWRSIRNIAKISVE